MTLPRPPYDPELGAFPRGAGRGIPRAGCGAVVQHLGRRARDARHVQPLDRRHDRRKRLGTCRTLRPGRTGDHLVGDPPSRCHDARATELGIDPARIVIAGNSAGGALAAATTLMARDNGGPALIGQLFSAPMLDDRDATLSTRQFDGSGPWNRGDNRFGWTALLSAARGTGDVPPYAAPARATDLSGLPPVYLDAGSAEVFRDEIVDYASRIWAAGGQAELHIWAGGFHGFQMAGETRVARAALAATDSWLARLLAAGWPVSWPDDTRPAISLGLCCRCGPRCVMLTDMNVDELHHAIEIFSSGGSDRLIR